MQDSSLEAMKSGPPAWADFIEAIAALAWPVVILIAIWWFKEDVKSLIRRLQRGEFFGQKIELAAELNALQEKAAKTSEFAKGIPSYHDTGTEDVVEQVIRLSAQLPQAALMLLRHRIETEIHRKAACLGLTHGKSDISVQEALSRLQKHGTLLGHIVDSVKAFWHVVSKAVHGPHGASESDILRAIDSGIIILKALQAIPHEINVVAHPGVDIFSDDLCKQQISGAKGVILDTLSPGGVNRTVRIFPTTRTHFEKDKQVAWEWSNEHTFGKAWYRDPDTSEIKKAWDGALEFIGRNIDDISPAPNIIEFRE